MVDSTPSRRDLLLAGVSGLAATIMPTPAAHAEQQAPTATAQAQSPASTPLPAVLKLSIAGYSFRQDLDKPGQPGKMSLFDLVDLCARLGIEGVEPTSYYFLRTDDQFIYELKRRVFLAGLEISGTPVGNNFCLPPGEALDKELAHVRTWVDYCAKLGSPAIRIFAGRPLKGQSREQAFANCVRATKEATTYAASKGIFLAIENHGYLTETADDVLRLLEAVDNKWLGINLDTGNFHDDPYGSMAKAAPYSVTCQVKTQVANPQTGKREPADLARIVQMLRDAPYRGYLALEYEGNDPHREVPIYIRKLQALVRMPTPQA